jgi:tetratricopeptide (TPR) repeat protein
MVDAPSKRVQAARGLWNQGRRNDAMALFDEAVRQEPNNVRTYVMAARAHAERFDFPKMDDVHERLVRRAPRHPGVHHYIGETYALLKLPQRALASFERAATLPGAGPPTWMELASLHERAHQLEQAEELIERTVRSGYEIPMVGIVRGRIQRRLKRLDEAESTLRAALAKMPEDSDWACIAWGELALMKDSQGNFAGAVEAIERCKAIQRRFEAGFLAASQQVHEDLGGVNQSLTRDHLARWAERSPPSPHRTALLTGFPRSGTTLLEQVLDAHPGVVSSEERDYVGAELYYDVRIRRGGEPLVDALEGFPEESLARHRQRYFQGMEYLLGESVGDRLHLDKNPAYNLILPWVLRLFPATRILTAIRDPRDVVLSCYLRYLPLNAVSVRFLDPRRTAERYALDMSAWLKIRELVPVPWREIRYEDAVADLAGVARMALETLGLPWDETVLGYRRRLQESKHVNSPSYEAVAQPVHAQAIGRWRNYAQILEPALPILEPFVRAFGYD